MKIYLICKLGGLSDELYGEVINMRKSGREAKEIYNDTVGKNYGQMIVTLNKDNIKDIINLAERG